MASIFNFVKKEGKYFAPIVNSEDKYIVRDGAVVKDGTKLVSGVKGVYATVRMTLPIEQADTEKEFFCLNTEMFVSS